MQQGFTVRGHWIDRHATSLLLLLLALYTAAQLSYSLRTPLWHDELFTFYIAQAPSTGAMLADVRHVDLNPPLSYLLTRLSFFLFGSGTLPCRLPEISGFALALVSIFAFVRHRAGGAWGLLAAASLFSSRAGELVTQARPYGLMLGLGAAALLCWQRCSTVDRIRGLPVAALWLIAFSAALSALLLTHVFGLLIWASLAVAELFQIKHSRRVAPLRLLAFTLPLFALFSWLPLLRSHATSVFPQSFQPTGSDIFVFYISHIDREITTALLTALVLLLTVGRSWLCGGSRPLPFTAPEWTAIIGFLLAPLLLMGFLMLTRGAFFDRYGVIACLGTAVLGTALLARWTGSRPMAAGIAALLSLTITGRLPDALLAIAQGHILRHTEPRVAFLPTSLLRNPELPLVTASGLTFLEMQRREPASLLHRTVYLTDTDAALTFAHATIFEGMPLEAQLFHLPSHVEPYKTFLAAHPCFYVLGTYDYPEDWLLRKLQADGATVEVLGRVEGSYKDHGLYLIHAPSQHLAATAQVHPLNLKRAWDHADESGSALRRRRYPLGKQCLL